MSLSIKFRKDVSTLRDAANGNFYLDVKKLGLDKYIEDGSIKSLDGSNGIEYKVGSRTDRNRYNDYDRDWLLISNKFFKPVVK